MQSLKDSGLIRFSLQFNVTKYLFINNLSTMERLTTSEKVRIELNRKGMTQAELAEKLNLEPMTISRRMSSNAWKPIEVFYMKNSLKFDI